ncbi:hypothetical protein V8J88_16025 [Massilia sp. W12]|uniref:hypothetical protein n=1 Tax=Massilia sp. W12 TaxID=3126507 RepID=UPI0030CE5A56
MQIHSSDVNDFYNWARLLIEDKGSWVFPEINLDLSFYGNDDSCYLVLEVYQNEEQTQLHQYVISSQKEENKKNNLRLIFDLLKEKDYNLLQLIQWLETSEFTESQDGACLVWKDLSIHRENYSYHPQEAQP